MGEPITFTSTKFANNYLKYKLHVIQVYYEIPLTCAQYAILNEREKGRFSRSVHESLLHVWLSFCMYVAYKRRELLHKGGSETFSFGTHHSLFTCEISYVHTCIRHPPALPQVYTITESKTINCHQGLPTSEIFHSMFEILPKIIYIFSEV